MKPEIAGLDGVLATYRQVLPQIVLGGPTRLGPVLEQFRQSVLAWRGQNCYSVLLLLTDGCCTDMKRTKELLVQLSAMAASVILIGIGNADFTEMHELDGIDGELLQDDYGRSVHRDVLQFVEWRDA